MENALGIVSFLRAGYPLFWVRTFELGRAMRLICEQLSSYTRKDGNKWVPTIWDCSKGDNPMKPIEGLDAATDFSVVFAMNYHWFLNKPQTIQRIQNSLEMWKSKGKALVIVAPKFDIPLELTKDFMSMDFSLPEHNEAKDIIKYVCGESTKVDETTMTSVLNAVKGLTATEIENVCARSLVEHGVLNPKLISDHKNQMVEREGLLEVVKSTMTFKDIRGYDNLKKFAAATVKNPKSRGILTIGAPGTGKTLFMHCLAGETGIPTLAMDFGKFFSKYQGETEQHVDAAISIITAYGRAIVMVDEFEKQFAGAAGSGDGDSGVTRRATGKWLRFISDRPDGIYIMGTCNSFVGIPPEYLRPGRWDSSPFFIDLPTDDEREDILLYHLLKNGINMKDVDKPSMDMWTGAEIAACCHIASVMNIPMNKAAAFVIPQAKTMEAEITRLREWADGRTIPASSIQVNGSVKTRKLDR